MPPSPAPEKEITTPSGLKYVDLQAGRGAPAMLFKKVKVHYTGWLEDGRQFDSSKKSGQAFSFKLGAGQVIPGWEEGLVGMQEGGRRKLIIPPALGYGDEGVENLIPPNSTLIFEVELISVK